MAQSPKKPPNSLAPLDRVGWLADQSEELKDWFAINGRWINSPPGKTLTFQGDKTSGIFGLGSGAMNIEFSPQNLDSRIVIRAAIGGWMGHAALIPGILGPINLNTPIESRLYFVPREALQLLLAEQPKFWPEFYSLAIQHMLFLMERLCETLELTPVERLARLLLRLSDSSPEITTSQAEFSEALGMPHSTLRRSLNSLIDEKAIKTGYGRITVIDRYKLQEMSREY